MKYGAGSSSPPTVIPTGMADFLFRSEALPRLPSSSVRVKSLYYNLISISSGPSRMW